MQTVERTIAPGRKQSEEIEKRSKFKQETLGERAKVPVSDGPVKFKGLRLKPESLSLGTGEEATAQTSPYLLSFGHFLSLLHM